MHVCVDVYVCVCVLHSVHLCVCVFDLMHVFMSLCTWEGGGGGGNSPPLIIPQDPSL